MSETERSEDAKRRRRRRGRREASEREVRDPDDLTPKPVLGDVPTTTTKLPGRDLAGTAVRAPEPKHPTDDADPPYVRSAKAVLDESNKIVKDAVGDVEGVGGGTTPRSMVAPATQFGGVGYGTEATADLAAVARRPFVLGTPHHAAGAAAMAGADPTALAAAAQQAGGDGADEAAISAAVLDASLAQVETAIRVMKRDLESLEEYYRELAAHRDELDWEREDAARGEDESDENVEDGMEAKGE